jgi:hypothetical protein
VQDYGFCFWLSIPARFCPGEPVAEQMSQPVKTIQETPRRPGFEEFRIGLQHAFRERERRRTRPIVDSAVIAVLEAL